jgi:formate-dependent nitrite reductase membrane component NrfD
LILVIAVGIFVVLYIALLTSGASDIVRKVVATLGLLIAIGLAFVNGLIYVLPARPAWNTLLWPFIYLASASALGLLTMYVWTALRKEEADVINGINSGALVTLAIHALLVVAYVIFLAAAPFHSVSQSTMSFLVGDMAWVFWNGVLLLGLVIPMWLTFRLRTLKPKVFLNTAGIGLACTCVGVVAICAVKYALGTSLQQFL